MSVFRNAAISASAGTGKTWALSHRYIALMAAGVDPEHICALTFSRKAAGEIYESIVERLCLAATVDAEREQTCQSMEAQVPGVSAPREPLAYVGFLRSLLTASHRLRIGTLDSFMLGIVRAFPLELGIPPDCRPMDNEGSEAVARREALLMKLYDPRRSGMAQDERIADAVLDAFRQATYGQEAKGLARALESGIADHYEQYLRHPARDWGHDPDRVWPPGTRWWEGFTEADRAAAIDPSFGEALQKAWGAGRGERLADTCAEIARASAGHTNIKAWPWTGKASSVLDQLLQQVADPAPATLTYYRQPYLFPVDAWHTMRAALANLVSVELDRTFAQTAGLRAMLERYDALYHDAQRTDGGMTFSDVTRLLSVPGHAPSRDPESDRLYIDYRLDGQLDHWLLDEFQDTSDDQWNAIANLAEEVVQGEDRSFFYVGDIKQSIYGWRQGNWRLFDRVRERFGMTSTPMQDCYRSRPAIVATVNAVFSRLPGWSPAAGDDKGPHPDAVAAFVGDQWPEHFSMTPKKKGDGFAALLEYKPEKRGADATDADEEDGDAAQYRAVADVLASIPFREKGLEVAVLVRSNKQGSRCADVLRRRLEGVAVVHEGVGGIVDNPVVTLLLALVRYAAHPGDTLVEGHVQMSPLFGACLDDTRMSALPLALLSAVHERGFAPVLREWGDKLIAVGALQADDAFGHQRLREFLAAAETFDATGSRDADAFEDHIRAGTVKAQAAANAVRVMTIHQSKGLGFDIVIVPFDSRARSFTDMRSTTLLMNDANAPVAPEEGWLLKTPKRAILDAAGGGALAAFNAARSDSNFDQLCALYVALTRAKAALYMLVPQLPKKPTSVREADLLRDHLATAAEAGTQLCGLDLLHRNGDAGWYAREESAVDVQVPEKQASAVPPVPFFPALVRREPSKEHMQDRPQPAAWLFREEAGDVPAFGQALHRLFEGIEWLEDADIEQVVADWRGESRESAIILDDVEKQFRACLESADARAYLCRPAAGTGEVWREAPFSLVRDGDDGSELISGRFDRVVVTRDASGGALRARIIDFKSNRIEDEAALAETAQGYTAQMQDYADAAARLLQLPPDKVDAVLLFTRMARSWSVQVAG